MSLTAGFFAAAAQEQAVVGMDVMAVPDFIAGFMYGMVGFNHMEEIENCYNGTMDVVDDVQKAVGEIMHGDYILGFAEIGLVFREVPDAMTTCENMDDDIAAIESWATIFTEPKELTETLGKNWLLHRKTIREYLSAEQSDWASGDYF